MSESPADACAFSVTCAQPFLIATFDALQAMLSWSMTHPGFCVARDVVWLEVRNADLPPGRDPLALLTERLRQVGHPDAVGLMTARDVRKHHVASTTIEDVTANVLTTVGVTNGETVGQRGIDPTARAHPVAGTINTLVHVSMPLAPGAMVEAMNIAVQARTVAVTEAKIVRNGSIITGTGTDCLVVATPQSGAATGHAGLHTAIGEAIGAATLSATRAGMIEWIRENFPG